MKANLDDQFLEGWAGVIPPGYSATGGDSRNRAESERWNFRYGQIYKLQGNDLPITLTGELDGGALKSAADCGGMPHSDWNNKKGY